MLIPCTITTRPFASVIQRPAWLRGGVGPGAAVAAGANNNRATRERVAASAQEDLALLFRIPKQTRQPGHAAVTGRPPRPRPPSPRCSRSPDRGPRLCRERRTRRERAPPSLGPPPQPPPSPRARRG